MMGFGTAIATCFRKYAVFRGRAPRAEFWFFVLFSLLASIVLDIVLLALLGGGYLGSYGWLISQLIDWAFGLFLLLPSLAVATRRLHDTGRSGWWVLADFLSSLVMVYSGLAAGVAFLASGFNPDALLAASGTLAGVFAVSLISTIVLTIALLFFYCFRSHPTNKYGPHPYQYESEVPVVPSASAAPEMPASPETAAPDTVAAPAETELSQEPEPPAEPEESLKSQ